MDFKDATYVAPQGGPGRAAEPNPFAEIVAAIALKKDENGKPVAKAFSFGYTDDKDLATLTARYKRQLSKAGEANEPAVTVTSAVKTSVKTVKGVEMSTAELTFWTGPRQSRPRKTATEQPATTA